MSLRKRIKRKAMALPMTLVILLFGSVLVATAFYVVQNMYSTSRHSVTHTELYNAAQSGIEQGKSLIAKEYTNLDVNEKIYNGSLDSVRAQLSGGGVLDQSVQEVTLTDPPDVKLYVDILDCNYTLSTGTFETLPDDERNELPPQWEAGSGSGGAFSEMEGTSMIMDPGRRIPLGGGGQRRYVIRSRASDGNQTVTIEALVRVKNDE